MRPTFAVSRFGIWGHDSHLVIILVLSFSLACGERGAWQSPPDPEPTAQPVVPVEARPVEVKGPSRILGWRIHREKNDHLLLDIEYVLTGAEGTGIMVSASAMQGKYAAPYQVWPELASKGQHTARIRLGGQPEKFPFTSDGLRLTLYPGGGAVFTELVVPYKKTWSAPENVNP